MGEVWIVRSVLLLWWLTWLGVVMWLTWMGVVVMVVMGWLRLKWMCCSRHYIAVARALGSVSVGLPGLIHVHCWTSVRVMDLSREQRLDWTREQWLDSLATVLRNFLHND
jgi:hypothetical protein